MDNFIFQNPVKLIMGRGMISRLSEEIPGGQTGDDYLRWW